MERISEARLLSLLSRQSLHRLQVHVLRQGIVNKGGSIATTDNAYIVKMQVVQVLWWGIVSVRQQRCADERLTLR